MDRPGDWKCPGTSSQTSMSLHRVLEHGLERKPFESTSFVGDKNRLVAAVPPPGKHGTFGRLGKELLAVSRSLGELLGRRLRHFEDAAPRSLPPSLSVRIPRPRSGFMAGRWIAAPPKELGNKWLSLSTRNR